MALDLFVSMLSSYLLNLNKQGVKETDKWYLSLLIQSFQIDAINNRHAA